MENKICLICLKRRSRNYALGSGILCCRFCYFQGHKIQHRLLLSRYSLYRSGRKMKERACSVCDRKILWKDFELLTGKCQKCFYLINRIKKKIAAKSDILSWKDIPDELAKLKIAQTKLRNSINNKTKGDMLWNRRKQLV